MKQNLNATHGVGRKNTGFTLIEILVVIAIIGLLAALITNLAPAASKAKKVALINAEKAKLIAAIDAYHEKFGIYPPDGKPAEDPDPQNVTNTPLFYELTGVLNTNNGNDGFVSFDGTSVLRTEFTSCFGKGGVVNSIDSGVNAAASGATVDMKNFLKSTLKPSQYKLIPGTHLRALVIPVTLDKIPADPNPVPAPLGYVNFWRYDSSSTNRHNPESYDLWAVFSSGGQIITNGNWVQ